jgi:hypothetical protein
MKLSRRRQVSKVAHGYKYIAPLTAPCSSTTRQRGRVLTAMTFAFLSGPASATECFLLDANLPTVKDPGSYKWRRGCSGDCGVLRGLESVLVQS